MLPERVRNTLSLGREVAARVDVGDPGWSAWLFVRPVIERDATWDAVRRHWTGSRESSRHFEPPQQFVVRYTRLSLAHLEAVERDDLDLAMEADPPEDWVVLAPELDSVERVLSRFLPDLESMRHPANVGYPEPPPRFARQRTLDDVLGAA